MKLKQQYILIFFFLALTAFYFGFKNFSQAKNSEITKSKEKPLPTYLEVPILMYHHVGDLPAKPNATRKDLTVPTKDFEQEVAWLSKQGYNSVSLQNLYLASTGKFTLPKKPIVFSFDDGYQDVFDNAVPILKKYNFTGSFGIITEWPGQIQGDNVYASWKTITSAKNLGMEIVCHSQNHFDGSNPKFDAKYILNNLTGCKNDLKSFGIENEVLIYPYGHYTKDYINQAQKAGFSFGVTVKQGDRINTSNLMEVPRVRVHGEETLQRFQDILLHKKSVH